MATTTEQVQVTRHEGGAVTVRYWSVYEQRWVEAVPASIPDRELAAMSKDARAQVMALVSR